MVRIAYWSAAAHHNDPTLREIRRNCGHSLKYLLSPTALLNTVTYRNRVNLWSMTAGMLDIARFMNTAYGTGTYGTTDKASSRERELYNELAPYIAVNYRKEMQQFRVEFRGVTKNFADDFEIKEALYQVIMSLPKDRIGTVSPFWLLRKAATKALMQAVQIRKAH